MTYHNRSRVLCILATMAALLLVLTGCERQNGQQKLHTIRYDVQGTATTAALTYRNSSGGTEQINVSLPWSTEFELSSGRAVLLSALNRSASGSVICTIRVDGKVFRTAESTGAGKLCSGRGVVGL